MKVSEAMTNDVRIANPDDTIREAAQTLAELDAGFLPVGEDDKLVGMITDRDIAIRAIAEGKGPDTKVRDVMTPDVKYASTIRRSTRCRRTWARIACAAWP